MSSSDQSNLEQRDSSDDFGLRSLQGSGQQDFSQMPSKECALQAPGTSAQDFYGQTHFGSALPNGLGKDMSLPDFLNIPLVDMPSQALDDSLPGMCPVDDNNQDPLRSGSMPQTVSPQELQAEYSSNPSPSSLSDLTTPETMSYASPWIADDMDSSPLFQDGEFTQNAQEWPSLFNDNDESSLFNLKQPNGSVLETQSERAKGNLVDVQMAHSASAQRSPPASRRPRVEDQRQASRPKSASRLQNSVKTKPRDLTIIQQCSNGTRKTSGRARLRDQSLSETASAKSNDTVAMKRARNTLAARKSRQKRLDLVARLQDQVADLESQVEHWRTIALAHDSASATI